ncbi:metallophosphoesterase [uncultured Sphaerochaeta sp.]|uniref:metallophosphoesterase n=1 Tax=uncultured Sphaerochaeta sp. TaxID=886478 RepID=UPI002A0A87B0|nr:metallophosphoesterase [uncultured Sphaerochaeta sp.]
MKVAMISDIHVDVNNSYDIIGSLVQCLKEHHPQLLVLAGDISGNIKITLSTVDAIESRSGVQVLFVPGNHDLWSENFALAPTEEIYSRFCEDSHCLCSHPFAIGNTVVIGDIGWYDYSFGSSNYNREEFSQMKRNGRIWQDSLKNQWTADNIAKNDFFLHRLEKQMMMQQKAKNFLMVTHMVPIREMTVPEDQKDWGYFNAFLGSEALEILYKKYPVRYALFGHVHYRQSFDRDNIHWSCRCLGYHHEWRSSHGPSGLAQIENALEFIEIE